MDGHRHCTAHPFTCACAGNSPLAGTPNAHLTSAHKALSSEPGARLPVLILDLFSTVVMAGAEAEDAVEGQVLFFPLTPLVTVTPPAIPAKRSSLLLVCQQHTIKIS